MLDLFISNFLSNVIMKSASSPDFEVLPVSSGVYGPLIGRYWNWLLTGDPDKNNPDNISNVYFLYACYDYTNQIQDLTQAQRVNLCTNPNTGGTTRKKPANISKNTRIFVPLADTLVHEGYRDANGNPLTPAEKDAILAQENDIVTSGDIHATIERIGSNQGPQPIVQNLLDFRSHSPVFSLKIDKASKFAEKMEFVQPLNSTFNKAKAEGFYLILKVDTSGTYHISTDGHGVRNYRALTDYYLSVQ